MSRVRWSTEQFHPPAIAGWALRFGQGGEANTKAAIMDADGVARLKKRIEDLEREVELLEDTNRVFKNHKQVVILLAGGMVGIGALGGGFQLLYGFGRPIWPVPCDLCSGRYFAVLAALVVVWLLLIFMIVVLTGVLDPPPAAAPTPTPAAALTPAASTPAAPPVPYNPASVPPVYEAPAGPPTPDFDSHL